VEFLVNPPCLLFEDDDLLVIHKPPGLNTHAPSPLAGEGIYEWLKNREPRWSSLALIHRLDKETSGVLVLAKSPLARQSLTQQFTQREITKSYLMLTDRPLPPLPMTAHTCLVRAGARYVNRPVHPGGDLAQTHFRLASAQSESLLHPPTDIHGACFPQGIQTVIEAIPVTGRTHQIRTQAAHLGFPLLGDTLYEGTPAPRLFLHAASLSLRHPGTGKSITFTAPVNFTASASFELRRLLVNPRETDSMRMIHGAADGWEGFYVDRFGDRLLAQTASPLTTPQHQWLEQQIKETNSGVSAIHHKTLTRLPGQNEPAQASPQWILGNPGEDHFVIRENGINYQIRFDEGYSVGLFLDQRDNRRRFLAQHIGAGFPLFNSLPGPFTVLNAFAYTCGFSVCAARAGAKVTSLDLSRPYLEWGRHNFTLNQIDPGQHDFIYGDVFNWLRRLHKKDRRFDVIVLDPPTFSRSKTSGVFRAEKDYHDLITKAVNLLQPHGILLASTNAARLKPESFLDQVQQGVTGSGRRVIQQHYAPQPPDFPITRDEPAYLKTVWVRLD